VIVVVVALLAFRGNLLIGKDNLAAGDEESRHSKEKKHPMGGFAFVGFEQVPPPRGCRIVCHQLGQVGFRLD